jgi:uncharacterized membrane-anchored protein
MTSGQDVAEETMDELLEVSAELETMAVDSSFRFGATAAYAKKSSISGSAACAKNALVGVKPLPNL